MREAGLGGMDRPEAKKAVKHPFLWAIVNEYYDGPVSGFAVLYDGSCVWFEQIYWDYKRGPRYYICYALNDELIGEVFRAYKLTTHDIDWFVYPNWPDNTSEAEKLCRLVESLVNLHGVPVMVIVADDLSSRLGVTRVIELK